MDVMRGFLGKMRPVVEQHQLVNPEKAFLRLHSRRLLIAIEWIAASLLPSAWGRK
jgi:hypothetical protein